MFGVKQRDHESRYEYAQEWIDVIKTIWSDKEKLRLRGPVPQHEGHQGQAEALRRHAGR